MNILGLLGAEDGVKNIDLVLQLIEFEKEVAVLLPLHSQVNRLVNVFVVKLPLVHVVIAAHILKEWLSHLLNPSRVGSELMVVVVAGEFSNEGQVFALFGVSVVHTVVQLLLREKIDHFVSLILCLP